MRITSFDTELIKAVSLSNFAETKGWQTKGKIISQESQAASALIWRGKPGSYIEITLEECDDCNEVEIAWNGSESQMVDRVKTGKEVIAVKYMFPSLWWQKPICVSGF